MRKLILFAFFFVPHLLFAQKTVLRMDIRAEIDPSMNRYVKLALQEAEKINADYVVIDMDTYGGAVTDADDIRTMLLDFKRPVFVFVNKNAASAGALISIACDSIYMAKGASIGAATVVSGADGTKMPDKYQSYMRGMMRSTAEAKGRNPQIAEAMVDENLEVPGVSPKGQVITFSASEAMKHGFCEAIVGSIDEVLERNGIESPKIVHFKLGPLDAIIAIFLNPVISSILILVIIGGIYYEMQSPGIGFPLLAAVIAGVLYFMPYYLSGLAANWEILTFLIGLALIGIEVFVIPGFGIVGILGIACTFCGLILVMLDNDWFSFEYVAENAIYQALGVTVAAFVGSVAVIAVGLANLTKTRFYKKVALNDTLSTADGFTAVTHALNLVGKIGRAHTVMRPSGKVLIGDDLYDATARNTFIEKGARVVVVSQEGTSLKVVEDHSEEARE